MSVQDLAGYRFQLSQVTEALERNPGNTELTKLQSDLKELISLAEKLYGSDAGGSRSPTSERKKSSKPAGGSHPKWSIGKTVRARWRDGKYHTATVEALPDSGSKSNSTSVAVKFEDCSDVEHVDPGDIRDLEAESRVPTRERADDPPRQQPGASVIVPAVPVTPATTAAISNSTTRPRKKYKPKNPSVVSKVDNYQTSKQHAWLSFISSGVGSGDGAKSSKRKITSTPLAKPALKKPSMFSTSDNPTARVGVIGSGKPMTQFHQRGKHIFSLKT